MNKKVLGALLALIALALGIYFLKPNQSSTPSQPTTNQPLAEAIEFASAIESGRPTTCTMTKGDDQMEYSLKDKMMLAKITTEIDGQTTLSHLLNDGQYLYLWLEGQNQGTKMSLATTPSSQPAYSPAENTPQLNSQADYEALQNDGYTIDCQPGTFSDSIFTPPSDIEFADPTAMLKAIPSPAQTNGADMPDLQELQKQYGGLTIPEAQ